MKFQFKSASMKVRAPHMLANGRWAPLGSSQDAPRCRAAVRRRAQACDHETQDAPGE